MTRSEEVLAFWFGPDPDDPGVILERAPFWFANDEDGPAIDAEVRARFGADYERACRGELADWADSPRGRLALILVLDQFSRNLFRDQAGAFAQDAAALALAQEGVGRADDRALRPAERVFFYMPFMHSEDLAVQKQSVALYRQLAEEAPEASRADLELVLDQAREHLVVIERFGRYPHRNAVLGRDTTAEEQWFLDNEPQPGRPADAVTQTDPKV